MKGFHTQTTLLNLVVMLFYLSFGVVSTGLTRSPEYFTPVWIPAGVVVVFSLLCGSKIIPGVVLGSIVFHFYFDREALFQTIDLHWVWINFKYVPMIIGHCYLSRYLLLKFASSPHFQPNLMTVLDLCARCLCLAFFVPLVTNLAFLLEGSEYTFISWFSSLVRWWFGDFLGIISLIPIPILLLQRKPTDSMLRPLGYITPILIYLGGLVVGYRLIADNEIREVEERFEEQVSALKSFLSHEMSHLYDEIEQFKFSFQRFNGLDASVFEQQSEHILKSFPSIHSINWMPLLQGRNNGNAQNFTFPTTLTVTRENESKCEGLEFDLGHPKYLGKTVEGRPFLVLKKRTSPGCEDMQVHLLLPVEKWSIEQLRTGESGAFGIFHMDLHIKDLLIDYWKTNHTEGLHFILSDVGEKEDPLMLTQYFEDQILAPKDTPMVGSAIFQQRHKLSFFGSSWELKVSADRKYLALFHSSAPFYLLVGGLGVSFLLGIHTLSIYLRTRVIEKTVEAQTRELRAAKMEAEHLAQAKSEFLAVMSHEIRTPMNGMISTSEILKKSLVDKDQEELAEIIEMSSHTLLALINDILDFSKLEAGKTKLEEEPFDPEEIAKIVEATFRAKTKEKGIQFQLVFQRHSSGYLMGDRNRFIQILMNLVSNAVKFTSKGSVKLTLKTKPAGEGFTDLVFKIEDTGIGIPMDKQDALFQPFAQADVTSTRRYGGTGLGLAIVKKIVELMNGQITLKSVPSSGSCFTVHVTLKNAHDSELKSQDSEALKEKQFQSFGDAKVLLVEDNLQNQKIMKLLLRKLDLDVDLAEDGLEAIEAYRKTSYDLVFMDCRLPNMDGFEATRRIRLTAPRSPRVPIIALTASTYEGAKEACIDSGMDDYLTKPVTIQSVSDKLSKWLRLEE